MMKNLFRSVLAVLAPFGLSLPAWATATVSITAPTNNQVFTAPASITLSASTNGAEIAMVEFYQGTTLIGTATASPYSISWSNVAAGSYSLTAQAKSSTGALRATSSVVAVIVNAPPTVSLTSPTANQSFATGSTITLTANAADSDGTVSKVDFYRGTTLIGTATTSPYTVTWSNAPAGSYSLTAKATDNRNISTTSAAVPIVVDAPPTVSLTSPTANQVFAAPGNVTLTASAAAGSGGTLAKVEFYQGATLIGTATASPYTATWSNVVSGTYTLTAKATDNKGGVTTSSPVTLIANTPPTIALTAPTAGQQFTAPASIALGVNAADADGSIASVAYFQNGNPLGTVTTAPFAYTWTNAPQGTYSLTAQATDNRGTQTTSAPIAITVNPAGPALGMYFIHPDHLNTPRVITNAANTVVWRWDNAEPFGNTPANHDPRATGTAFPFNPRFPGQYYDAETGLAYNYFRDYDPGTGRYVQSDPIGLDGGSWSTYSYSDSSPLSKTDYLGLATYMCRRGLANLPIQPGPLFHQYVCTGNAANGYSCGGLGPTGSMFNSPGKIESDPYKPERCEKVQDDNACMESCIQDQLSNQPTPNYSVNLSHGENCQTFANATVSYCKAKCSGGKK